MHIAVITLDFLPVELISVTRDTALRNVHDLVHLGEKFVNLRAVAKLVVYVNLKQMPGNQFVLAMHLVIDHLLGIIQRSRIVFVDK